MKIVCDACQAKYSIADDKVRGKVFKIRCKKCSHVIVVRGTDDMAAPAARATGSIMAVDPFEAPAAAPRTESAWHIVVDGEQVGPLPDSDIRARLARGEINADTFAWKEGLADWLKVGSVPEFAGATTYSSPSPAASDFDNPFAPQPTVAYAPGVAEMAYAAAPGSGGAVDLGDVFGAGPKSGPKAAPPADLFASPVGVSAPPEAAPFSFGGFGAAADSAPARGGNGAGAAMSARADSLTGQRHENSVLFSLSNLEALAKPSGAFSALPSPGSTGGAGGGGGAATTEGSGLIDIRSMAQMTLGSPGSARMDFGSGSAGDLPTFAPPSFSPVAPVLLPISRSSGAPTWVYPVLGVLVLVLGGMGFMIFKIINTPVMAPVALAPTGPATVAPTAGVPAVALVAPTAAASPPSTPPPSNNEALPPREGDKPLEGTKVASNDRPSGKGGKSAKSGKTAKAEVPGSARPVQVAAAAPAAAKPVEKAAPAPAAAPKKGGDALDDLLNGALNKKPAVAAARREDDEPKKAASAAKGAIPKEDIVKAMMSIQPKLKDCFNQFKVPGVANLRLKVDPSGKVGDASVSGKFAGTPTAGCVEAAARGARFPANDGERIDYPVALR